MVRRGALCRQGQRGRRQCRQLRTPAGLGGDTVRHGALKGSAATRAVAHSGPRSGSGFSANGACRIARRISPICFPKLRHASQTIRCSRMRNFSMGDSGRSIPSDVSRWISLQVGLNAMSIRYFKFRYRAGRRKAQCAQTSSGPGIRAAERVRGTGSPRHWTW
jgi:hypothetical protein